MAKTATHGEGATMAGVSPQIRGVVPPEHVDRLLAAQRVADEATETFRAAVADALKAGGSVREVAGLLGLSTNTVRLWGEARGWPTAEQKATREQARANRAELRRQVDEAARRHRDA